ncbi:MAG TPA: hypothetical protein VMM12_11570 [Longimicrobiales bacterium]|nr:hypothetical protein [Longimicrobiales bacterium]
MRAFPLPLLAVVAALLLLPACEAPAPGDGAADADASADFAPVDRSGVTGTVRAEHEEDEAAVTVELAGLQPGTVYTVHIHTGRCSAGGLVAATLGDVTAGSDGTGRLSATVAGSPLGPDSPAFVQALDAAGDPVACADLPGHSEQPGIETDSFADDSIAPPEGAGG